LGGALVTAGRGSSTFTFDEPDAGVVLTAVTVSRETGWRVVVAQPRSAARATGLQHLRTILLGIVLASVLTVLLAFRMARRVTNPIVQLSQQLRQFDGEAPRNATIVVPPDVPAEVEALLREFCDMSERVRETTGAQQASEARFRAIFDHAAIGIALHDDEGRILESNAAFQQIVGYSGDELRRMRASQLSSPEEAAITREPVRALKEGKVQRVSVEKHMLHRAGHSVLCALTVSRLHPDALPGGQGGIVGMIEDVTERRTMERELVWRANHDALTGLSNRVHLHERVESVLMRRHAERSVAVLALDLDEFKRVNDSLGHTEGDRLLREVSQRLLSATRGCDTVARLGGDEFAVLLDGVGTPVFADIVAERILHSLKRPIALQGGEVVLSASIGIAYAEPGETVDELLRNADTAMYRAKRAGKAMYDTFTPAMYAEVANMLSMETDLRGAVDANELHAVYQLIVKLDTGEPVGAECLLRWRRHGTQEVSPVSFIPIAEQTGLIIPIGRWVLREACRAGAAWLARAPRSTGDARPFTMTVNLSGRQLHDADLVSDVRAALEDSGFDPRCLVLEITESVVMRNADVGISRLEELRALGVRLAIDDFGTGYSSLSYLQRLPIDVLKIDKSFIDGVDDDARGAALVRTILGLAETMSLRCVAEGIETESQLQALTALGCAYGQGFLFAHPLPADAAGERLVARVTAV
jgi:diguanylate cyclase (GGDEF)-like protein/PAS domain S-box-containing protein